MERRHVRGVRPRAVLILIAIAAIALAAACSSAGRPAPVSAAAAEGQLPGKFVWHDLLTSDVAAAKQFYGGLFGWTFREVPAGGLSYTVVLLDGKPIGGIVETKGNNPTLSQWLSHMSVPDVDGALITAKAAGATVEAKPFDVPGEGRLAVIADPQGAPLGLFRADGPDPADAEAPVHGWLWVELLSPDTASSARFYGSLVGYEVESRTVLGRSYELFTRGGAPRAGLLAKPFPNVKPNWLPYVRVGDVGAVVAKVESLGGKVLLPPNTDVRQGNVAIVADPTGAALAIQKWPVG